MFSSSTFSIVRLVQSLNNSHQSLLQYHRKGTGYTQKYNQYHWRNHSSISTKGIKKRNQTKSKQPKDNQLRNNSQQQPTKIYNLFASTLPGLEYVLSHELESKICIKKNQQKITNGGISFKVSCIKDLYKCHLHLGTASHLYLRATINSSKGSNEIINHEQNKQIRCKKKNNQKGKDDTKFYAIHEKQLVQKVRNMDIWKEIIPAISPKDVPILDIRVSATKSKLHHTKMIADLVRKGIHQSLDFGGDSHSGISSHNLALNDAFNKCFNEDGPTIRVLVRIHYDEVQLSIDTSQLPLHKRGYKLDVRKAPLREDIAFGLLYDMGWADNKETSTHTSKCLIDPFCGSGTILIEGAMMALGIPPGCLRSAPCEHTSLYDENLWHLLIEGEMKKAKSKFETSNSQNYPLIVGGDRDNGAIEATLANAKRAGVDEIIQVEGCAIKANRWLNPQTILSSIDDSQKYQTFIVSNLPFGVRVSKSSPIKEKKHKGGHPLLPLYQTFGNEVMKVQELKEKADMAVNIGLIAHDVDLARKTGIADLKSLFTTHHGGISVVAMSDRSK